MNATETTVGSNSPVGSINTTAQNDTVTSTLANLAGATLAGGAGTDTLTVTRTAGQAAFTLASTVTGFEALTINGWTNTTATANEIFDITLSAANVAANTTMTVTSTHAGLTNLSAVIQPGLKFDSTNLTTVTSNINFTGGSAEDSVTAGAGNDTINGGSGNDTIKTATAGGINSISGGDGDDSITIDEITDTSTTNRDTVDGGAGNDTVISLVAGSITGSLAGGTGSADTLSLATSDNITAATVSGFENLTVASGGSVTMTVAQLAAFTGTVTGAGTETITLTGAGGTVALPTAIEVVSGTALTSTSTFSSASKSGLKISGSTVTDVTNTISVTGTTAAAVSIVGGGGNDTINIAMLGDSDTVAGGTGTDTLNTTGNTALSIGNTNLVTAVEVVNFDNTTTNVSWATKAGTIGAGTTAVVFNATSMTTGALTFDGSADDGTTGAVGKVSVTGGAGDDSLTGTAQADTLIGGAGSDVIVGGGGNDTIDAGANNNTVTGGLGADSITLGAGSSKVVFAAGSIVVTDAATVLASRDTVTGFNTGTLASGGDTLQFSVAALASSGGTLDLVPSAGATILFHSITPGVAASLTGSSNVNVILGTTGTSLTSALNGATVTGITTADYLVAYYNANLASMVVSVVTNASGTVLEGSDAETIVAVVGMSTTDYGSLNIANFGFVS